MYFVSSSARSSLAEIEALKKGGRQNFRDNSEYEYFRLCAELNRILLKYPDAQRITFSFKTYNDDQLKLSQISIPNMKKFGGNVRWADKHTYKVGKADEAIEKINTDLTSAGYGVNTYSMRLVSIITEYSLTVT